MKTICYFTCRVLLVLRLQLMIILIIELSALYYLDCLISITTTGISQCPNSCPQSACFDKQVVQKSSVLNDIY